MSIIVLIPLKTIRCTLNEIHHWHQREIHLAAHGGSVDDELIVADETWMRIKVVAARRPACSSPDYRPDESAGRSHGS